MCVTRKTNQAMLVQSGTGRSFASCATPGRRPPVAGKWFSQQLDLVGVHDRRNQSRETLLDLRATRGVLHLDPSTLAAYQPCLAESLEVLRQCRFGYRFIAHIHKV